MPSETNLKELGETMHRRLLAREDSRVTSEIAELFLPLLATDLHRQFPQLSDPHLAETAAIDTLMDYFTHPEKYDPSRRSLIGYLYLSARRDLLNLMEKRKKVVALHPPLPEYEVQAGDDENPEERLLAQDSPIVRCVLLRVIDPVDRELVALMMDSVRDTASYAAVLSITDRPPNEQAEIVKQHKDRLKKSIRREIQRHSTIKR